MKTGFIGTGSMGSILIRSFIRSGALDPAQIMVSNRTHSKAALLSAEFQGLQAVVSNLDIVSNCNIVFLCVKPFEYKAVIDEIRDAVDQKLILVSITSPVLVSHLEFQLQCKIAKVIPSITNMECSGASLCIYGTRLNQADRQLLDQLFANISRPIPVEESYTRVTSDISSCGPAFLAYFIQQLVDAAVLETGISPEHATRLACEMVLGTGKLLTSEQFTPQSLQARVSVPGGITAEGLHILSKGMNDVFRRVIQATHSKYDDDLARLNAVFFPQKVD